MHGRADRSGSRRAVHSRRYLQNQFQADHGDDVGNTSRIFMKLIVDVSTSHVLIGHTTSPDAAETIQIVGDVIRMQTTKADFDVTIAVNQSSAKELMTMRVPTQHYVARVPEWADQKYSPNTMFRAAFHLLR
ncbi:hypothetical protein [Bradyrhizobium sp. G127]|uniref:hypothetical protein n=1 Tax=Bradyrhizobium sp. G127 TaxID=2904800 RepID=UPI0024C0C3C8|nr:MULTISPECIES: hypothetical protein [Nitrobacteraceae]